MVTAFLVSLPAAVVAVFIGAALGRKIPAARFNRYVYVLMLVLGLALLIKNL